MAPQRPPSHPLSADNRDLVDPLDAESGNDSPVRRQRDPNSGFLKKPLVADLALKSSGVNGFEPVLAPGDAVDDVDTDAHPARKSLDHREC